MNQFNCPFIHKNKIQFPFKAINDYVFLWPLNMHEIEKQQSKKQSIIHIPEQFKKRKNSDFGIILSIGKGYWDKKESIFCPSDGIKPGDIVAYDNTTPWFFDIENHEKKEYIVRVMCYKDIRSLVFFS